jgi:hypothetical protein
LDYGTGGGVPQLKSLQDFRKRCLNKPFWAVAVRNGVAFVHYLKAFNAMREGFASGNFIYGLIVAKRP